MGVLDAQVHIGRETTYGTAVTPTRSLEVINSPSEAIKPNIVHQESRGARAGMQTLRANRQRAVSKGAEGTIEIDAPKQGLGMLLRAALGSSSIAQQGGTAAYLQTHDTTATGPFGESLTVQVGLPPLDPTAAVEPVTAAGGKVTALKLTQEVDDFLKVEASLDYRTFEHTTAAATPVYANAELFSWEECVVTVDGGSFAVRDFELELDNNAKTDHYALNTASKHQPRRMGIPEITGSITGEFDSMTSFDRWVAGTVVPMTATWTGAVIAASYNYELKVTLGAVQFTGDMAEVSLDDIPSQPLPFRVLQVSDLTSPAVRITYQSTDTAY